jgi:hypothetical protein
MPKASSELSFPEGQFRAELSFREGQFDARAGVFARQVCSTPVL